MIFKKRIDGIQPAEALIMKLTRNMDLKASSIVMIKRFIGLKGIMMQLLVMNWNSHSRGTMF